MMGGVYWHSHTWLANPESVGHVGGVSRQSVSCVFGGGRLAPLVQLVTEGDDQIYDKLPRNNNSVADSLVRPNGKHIYPLNFGCTSQCDTLRRYLVILINGRSISRERWRFVSRCAQLRGLSSHGRDTPELGGRGGRGGRVPLWNRSNFKTAWVSGQRDWATRGGERSRSVSCKPGGEQRVPAPHHPETGVIQVNLAHSKQLEQGKSDKRQNIRAFFLISNSNQLPPVSSGLWPAAIMV